MRFVKFFVCLMLIVGTNICLSEEYKSYPIIKGTHGQKYHTGLRHKKKDLQGLGEMHVKLADCENLPEYFDLRSLGTVPSIKDQGSCGSCWSFSLTGSLESALLASGGPSLDLSEQELVSCDRSQYGCDGGNLNDFSYQNTHGQGLETDFPYTSGRTGRDGSCKSITAKAKGINFAYVGSANRSPTEKEVKCALFKTHTIPWITVSAGNAWGNPPASENTMFKSCNHGGTNHAIGIVGWKVINGKTGFIIKNSWGTNWGASGYAVLPLGCDSLGEEVAYVMTDSMPCKPPMVKLPATIEAEKGMEVMLGVKEQTGVNYTWYTASEKVGDGPTIYVNADSEAIYKLIGKNDCGSSESSIKIKVN